MIDRAGSPMPSTNHRVRVTSTVVGSRPKGADLSQSVRPSRTGLKYLFLIS